jgi:enamine deaminase RidA (YjgF/YER057c/UK114 family)
VGGLVGGYRPAKRWLQNHNHGSATMKTVKPINPWPWSLKLGFDQAQVVEDHQRQLVCSGQDAVDADGNPQHPGDMAAQLELALDNLEAVA